MRDNEPSHTGGEADASGIPRRKTPSYYDWAEIRPLVEAIYGRNQKRGETEKISLIQQKLGELGFQASISTIRDKLREWGFRRYNNEPDMLALIRKAKQALVQDDTKRYWIGGRVVSLGQAFRYFERKGVRRSRWDEEEVPFAATPDGFRSWQASGSASPSNGSVSPGSNSNVTLADAALADIAFRQLFQDYIGVIQQHVARLPSAPTPLPMDIVTRNLRKGIKDYFSVNLEAPRWSLATMDRNIDDECPSMSFGGLFLRYHNMRSLRQHKEAHDTLTVVCARVKPLLQVEDPRLLLYFLEAVAFCRANGYHELANNLITLFAGQAREMKGTQHPQAVVFASLLNENRQTQDALMEHMLIDMMHLYRHYLKPPYTLETANVLLTGAMVLKHLQFYTSACLFLAWLQPMYYAFYGEKSWQMVQCLVDRAHIHIASRELVQAQELIDYALVCCDGIEDRRALGESKIRYFVALATLREMQRDMLQVQYLLQLGIEAGHEACLEDDHWAMSDVLARHAQAKMAMGASVSP